MKQKIRIFSILHAFETLRLFFKASQIARESKKCSTNFATHAPFTADVISDEHKNWKVKWRSLVANLSPLIIPPTLAWWWKEVSKYMTIAGREKAVLYFQRQTVNKYCNERPQIHQLSSINVFSFAL